MASSIFHGKGKEQQEQLLNREAGAVSKKAAQGIQTPETLFVVTSTHTYMRQEMDVRIHKTKKGKHVTGNRGIFVKSAMNPRKSGKKYSRLKMESFNEKKKWPSSSTVCLFNGSCFRSFPPFLRK